VKRVLILNPGSSSLKWSLLDAESEALLGGADMAYASVPEDRRADLVRRALDAAGQVDAVGFRVVHGGMLFRTAVLVDHQVLDQLDGLAELAPLHNPIAVACMREALAILPNALHVAAFDTAFHRTIPEEAATYALPAAWSSRWGIRRFGFHGLSVAYAARQAERLLGRVPGRHVVCHLGAGCSVTAVLDGQSVDTTMGFTPLDGVMMATRSGAVDPGLLLYLIRRGTDVDRMYDTLEHASGLLGVSGISSDIRDVLRAASAGNSQARLACDMFVQGVIRAVGWMTAALGGIDVLTFTGGVGEHQPPLRREIIDALAFTDAVLDQQANDHGTADRDIAAARSTVRVLVITAREDLSILREVMTVAARPA
jgi:acetate kinase